MSDKNFLIIGASSDVGLSYLAHLGETAGKEEHYHIHAHYRSNRETLDCLSEKYPSLKITPVQADLSQEKDLETLLQKIRESEYLPSYFLFLPAETFRYMRLKEFDTETLRRGMQIQTESFLSIAKEIFPKMKKNGGGHTAVMLTSYLTEEIPPKFMVDYITIKYALLGAMKAIAAEYEGSSVVVNGLAPSMMETKFLKNIDEKILKLTAAKNASGRLLHPEDLHETLDLLLSDSCSLNGEVVKVEG